MSNTIGSFYGNHGYNPIDVNALLDLVATVQSSHTTALSEISSLTDSEIARHNTETINYYQTNIQPLHNTAIATVGDILQNVEDIESRVLAAEQTVLAAQVGLAGTYATQEYVDTAVSDVDVSSQLSSYVTTAALTTQLGDYVTVTDHNTGRVQDQAYALEVAQDAQYAGFGIRTTAIPDGNVADFGGNSIPVRYNPVTKGLEGKVDNNGTIETVSLVPAAPVGWKSFHDSRMTGQLQPWDAGLNGVDVGWYGDLDARYQVFSFPPSRSIIGLAIQAIPHASAGEDFSVPVNNSHSNSDVAFNISNHIFSLSGVHDMDIYHSKASDGFSGIVFIALVKVQSGSDDIIIFNTETREPTISVAGVSQRNNETALYIPPMNFLSTDNYYIVTGGNAEYSDEIFINSNLIIRKYS